ncbi:hypothetical protein BDZ85DRAFT_320350 [Elsinoe ampelina]|uniref:Rhodopsin domain-containing protein n=1 Tax=Elsinoe ampelina TaxID=302913 RepID=A0A6A6G8S5_9PEZI|nr:hypothetical protein BDZ85DRAFT_320350 [Elsinoe ampelina]
MTQSPEVHRWMEVTSTNHKPWLYVATLLSMLYAISVLGIRLFVKYGAYALDDAVVLGGYAFGIVQWTLTLSALQRGLGMAPGLISSADEASAGELIFSGRVTLHLLLGMVKISCLCLLRNIFTTEHHKAWSVCNLLIGICAVCAVAASLVATVGCHPSTTLIAAHGVTCKGMRSRALALCVMEAATQLFCGVIPAYLFLDIQMTRQRRFVVSSAFIFPIFNGVLFIWHVYSYSRWINSGLEHSNIGLVDPLVIQQVLVCYALVSATIPCLKGFASRFGTGGIRDTIRHDHTPSTTFPSTGGVMSYSSNYRPRQLVVRDRSDPGSATTASQFQRDTSFEAHDLGHKISHSKIRDFTEIPDSAYLLPPRADNIHHPSPSSSISSCTAIALTIVSPLSESQRSTSALDNLPIASSSKQSKGKAPGPPDWTKLNDYSNQHQSSTAPPHESPQIGPTDRKPSSTPFSVNTTPPLDRIAPSNNPPPFSSLSLSRPSSSSSRRPSGKHHELLEAQHKLSLRPDVDPVFGLGSTATAEATPVEARKESWPWAFGEGEGEGEGEGAQSQDKAAGLTAGSSLDPITVRERDGRERDVGEEEKERGPWRKDSRGDSSSLCASTAALVDGATRAGVPLRPLALVRRSQDWLKDGVPRDASSEGNAGSSSSRRGSCYPIVSALLPAPSAVLDARVEGGVGGGEEPDALAPLAGSDGRVRGRQLSGGSVTGGRRKRNRANSIVVTREVKLETSEMGQSVVGGSGKGSRVGSVDKRWKARRSFGQ